MREETLMQCVLDGYFVAGVGWVPGGRVIEELERVRRRVRCWVESRAAEGCRARLVTIAIVVVVVAAVVVVAQ